MLPWVSPGRSQGDGWSAAAAGKRGPAHGVEEEKWKTGVEEEVEERG
jgi:hypothetical protein